MLPNGNSVIKKVDTIIADESLDTLCEGAKEVLKHIQDWPSHDIKFELFKDGITNRLLKCYLEDDPDHAVLIRVYGKKTELFIDRQMEVQNMQAMYNAEQCPPLFCAFQNGLCYGYSPGNVLDIEMVSDPKISRLIAYRLAKMHSIKNHANGVLPQPSLFPVLLKYIQLIPDTFSDPIKQEKFSKDLPSKKCLLSEVNTLKVHLTDLGSPVVFCHNDLLLKNIIYNEEKDLLTFIDFEYASYNYQAFDIGNHFCEFAGVDSYEPERYPSKEFQMTWLRHYLEEWYSVNGWSTTDVTNEKICQLYVQVNKFSLAAHLFWGLWALIQAAHSTLDFDFLGYAQLRLSDYFEHKTQYLDLDFQANTEEDDDNS